MTPTQDPPAAPGAAAPPGPVCPHCGDTPARIMVNMMPQGAFTVVCLSCGNPACRKIHSIQVLQGTQGVAIAAPGDLGGFRPRGFG